MELSLLFRQLGIALGLGLLVGLQREHQASRLAGIRTFPLITMLGTLCALLSQSFGAWLLAAGMLALAAIIVIGNIAKWRNGESEPGLTTEVAMLMMYAVGALLTVGYEPLAIAVGGGVAVLLQYKAPLHGLAARLGDNDLKAIMQFALISLVILPILPDKTYGPYTVWNPRQIWWMVALIVGISLAGYIIYKFFGTGAGVVLSGTLGGLISSTATTVSFSRRTANEPSGSRLAALIIMIASAIVCVRVLVEIVVVAPSFFGIALWPVAGLLMVLATASAILWHRDQEEATTLPEQQNPSELKTALLFGLVYAIVLLAVAAAKEQFGARGLYGVAVLSGLTDVDAITLSTAQLVDAGRLGSADGWRVVVIALLSNLLFKGVMVATLGHRRLLKQVAWSYSAAIVTGVGLLWLWP